MLAETLTYITHRGDAYFAVTMDYSRLGTSSSELLDAVTMTLDVVELTRDQAIAACAGALKPFGAATKAEAFLTGAPEPEHWTVAVMGQLKPSAAAIRLGRLRWVLRTALPLSPSFVLHYNDDLLESSKLDHDKLWTFEVGSDEGQLESSKGSKPAWHTAKKSKTKREDGTEVPVLELPLAGNISGTAYLFRDSIKTGKSEEQGRSHGFFVRVLGRLINIDVIDGDFGLDVELHHGTLTRFHMEVEADGLDPQVASARENLKESPALQELKDYLLAVFNKARTMAVERDHHDPFNRLGKDNRLADPPIALSQGPLRRMLRRVASGDGPVQETFGLTADDAEIVDSLLDEDDDLIDRVLLEDLGETERFVVFRPAEKAAVLNSSHPFVGNYMTHKKAIEPLKLLGLTELLTEAYLLDEDVVAGTVSRVMRRRDAFLRALVLRFPRSATVIAKQLRDSGNDEDALEDTVADALTFLGYSVKKLGGAKHGTDGIAMAQLGRRYAKDTDSYALTYDAKSSGKASDLLVDADGLPLLVPDTNSKDAKIRADTARTSVLRVHREGARTRYKLPLDANYTLLVAPDFQGAEQEQALIHQVCRNDGITPLRVRDLATLVELQPLHGLNPSSLRPLFDLHSPADTRSFVEDLAKATHVPRPRIDTLIQMLVKYGDENAPISLEYLHAFMITEKWDGKKEDLEGLVRGLQALAPKSFFFDGQVIALNATPEALYAEIRSTLETYDDGELVAPYLASLASESK